MLDEIGKNILIDIYNVDHKNGPVINENNYDFGETDVIAKRQALVYYVNKLERLSYVEIDRNKDGKYYIFGGRNHQKYGNAARLIDYDRIHISDKGKLYIEELRKNTWDKFKSGAKIFVCDILNQVRLNIVALITWVLTLIILTVIIGFLAN